MIGLGSGAQAAPLGAAGGLGGAGEALNLSEKAQFFYGGARYCWYDGWRGPGWYQCGFGWRRGYGWGGPLGWQGWSRGPYGGGRSAVEAAAKVAAGAALGPVVVPEAAWARAAQVEARVRLPAAAEVDPARAAVDRAVDQRVRAAEKAVIPAVGDFRVSRNAGRAERGLRPFSRARAGPHRCYGCHPQPLAVVFGHAHDVHRRGTSVPKSLPEFQRLFPDDAACAGYLEKARWSDGFCLPPLSGGGRAVPLRKSSWRLALPQVPP